MLPPSRQNKTEMCSEIQKMFKSNYLFNLDLLTMLKHTKTEVVADINSVHRLNKLFCSINKCPNYEKAKIIVIIIKHTVFFVPAQK